MYQLGGKMAEGVDYVTATLKGVEAAEDGTLIGKQAGPGKVTEWVNARHAESTKFMDGKIQGLEASLATRIGNASSGVSKEVSGVKGMGENIIFKPGYETHLIEVEGFKAKPTIGVKGGHNFDNFKKFVLDNFGNQITDINQAIVTKTPHQNIDGIYEIKYKLPAYDGLSTANGGKGNFTGQWKEYKNPKTVYDPNVISDEQILKWGREAMAEGISNNRIKIDSRPNAVSNEVVGYADIGGEKLQFIGYIDKTTGEVKNFFHVFPKQ
ncbi:CdiA family toxin C-terminal domain-containing protein [Bacillus pseudomycoides]|uniref:CdiA family toxin C-terminal domain-containing protein n=1 Tax=Bacillus pseudomycoides TaxID=64104 RepID=UPI00211D9411|nr:CdiA family toxin C-terminal domain-containing protein [Bacillus pseudomycoides]